MAILLTTLYNNPRNPKRIGEFLTCLEKNLANPYIEKIKILFEIKDESLGYSFLEGISHEKLEIIPTNQRASYSDMITLANSFENGQLIIIANGDIFFEEESFLERSEQIGEGEFWAISRYEPVGDSDWSLTYIAQGGSHDCWVFRVPLPAFKSDYQLGIKGCDIFIVQRAIESGLKVLNPCLSIYPRHYHKVIGLKNDRIDPSKNTTYMNDPEYAPLGTKMYNPLPCSLEKPIYVTNRSLKYIFMSLIGRWLVYIRRNLISSTNRPMKNYRTADNNQVNGQ
jgi:hypothetical protein